MAATYYWKVSKCLVFINGKFIIISL